MSEILLIEDQFDFQSINCSLRNDVPEELVIDAIHQTIDASTRLREGNFKHRRHLFS
jgi:hypothetical protein